MGQSRFIVAPVQSLTYGILQGPDANVIGYRQRIRPFTRAFTNNPFFPFPCRFLPFLLLSCLPCPPPVHWLREGGAAVRACGTVSMAREDGRKTTSFSDHRLPEGQNLVRPLED